MPSAARIIKRAARRDLHRELQVAAYYYAVTGAPTQTLCSIRLWIRNEHNLSMDGLPGAIHATLAEDRIRFLLPEFSAPLRNNALVSIEPGEAYRIDHLYPADDEFQTARVTRLSAAEAAGLLTPP